MDYITAFMNVKSFFTEEDLLPLDIENLDFERLGYKGEDEFKEVISPFELSKVYATKNPLCPFIYVDYENFLHTELFDLSKKAIESFVKPSVKQTMTKRERKQNDYYGIYMMMYSNMRALDFIKNYKRIPREQIKEVFLYIYQTMDYKFDVFPPDVLAEVFKIIKEGNNGSSQLIKIYRGEANGSTPKERALSWTTDYKTASFFANRFGEEGIIYQGYIKECDIIHRDTEGEYEVLCLYKDIVDVKIIN